MARNKGNKGKKCRSINPTSNNAPKYGGRALIPAIYCYIYERLRKNCLSRYLEPNEILSVIRTTVRMPKPLGRMVLKEMEDYKMIKRINHKRYLVLQLKIKKIKDFVFW